MIQCISKFLSSYTRNFFVHRSSFVDRCCIIGKNTKVWPFSRILRGCLIGDNCNIGQNVVIGPNVAVGDNCKIQNNVSIYQGVILEDNVFCGPSCVFTNVSNPRSTISRMDEIESTLVKKGATIGANSTIVCGNTIGRYAFVGAGSVVTHSILDYALVAGNPARQIGWICACGTKIDFVSNESIRTALCLRCNKNYAMIDNKIVEM